MNIKNKSTILIIESDINSAAKLSILLNDIGFKTLIATSEIKVYEEIALSNPQIILLNSNFNEGSSKKLLVDIHEKFVLDKTSIIVISNNSDFNDKLFFLSSGANDFISSNTDFLELTARIKLQQKTIEKYTKLQQRLKLLQEQNLVCKKLAMTDELTGLYNKRYLVERLKIEINYSQRYNRPLSLLMIDIDHFKSINDTYGHLIGDIVLKETSNTIYKFLRDSDIFIRYGGEEFIIVLPNTSVSASKNLAERIRKKVSQSFIKLNLIEISITISIGISRYISNKGNSSSEEINRLIHEADLALYSAKSTGRNKTIIYPFNILNPPKLYTEKFSIIANTKKTLIENNCDKKKSI
ncbi:MAG: diguanylate cyclase [Clostridiales bacterium]